MIDEELDAVSEEVERFVHANRNVVSIPAGLLEHMEITSWYLGA